MDLKDMSIEDALKKGISVEDLQNKLLKEINEAKAKIDAETKTTDLDKARKELAVALLDYVSSFDDETYDSEDVDNLVNMIKELESEIKKLIDIAKILGMGTEEKKPKKSNDWSNLTTSISCAPDNILTTSNIDKIIEDLTKQWR